MLWSQFCFSHRPTRENTWVLKNLSSVPDQRPWLNQSESKQATKWLIHDTRWELWWCGESLSRACLFLHSAFLWGFTSQPRPQSIPLSAWRVRCLRLKQRNHRQTHIRYYFIAWETGVCFYLWLGLFLVDEGRDCHVHCWTVGTFVNTILNTCHNACWRDAYLSAAIFKKLKSLSWVSWTLFLS